MAKWEFTEFRSNVPLRILAGDDNGGPMFNRLYSRYNCHLHTAPLWELFLFSFNRPYRYK